MAKIKKIADQAAWNAWVASRPPVVQELCALLPPDRLYLLKSSGHRVTLVSYEEDRTLTVAVSGEFNALTFERQVFGIKPEDLQECDLPGDDIWQELECPKSGIDFDLEGDEMLVDGQQWHCSGCGGHHTVGQDIQVQTYVRCADGELEYRRAPKDAAEKAAWIAEADKI